MKRVSEIRVGLRRIGALIDTPSGLGVEGPEPGVEVPRQVYGPDVRDGLELAVAPVFDPEEQGGADGEEDGFELLFEVGPDIEEAFAAMSGETGSQIRQSTLTLGTDALGYYIPFHVVGAQWGAYVRQSGILWLAATAFRQLELSIERKCTLALHAILSHELFHFAAETAIAQAEMLFGEPWFVAAKLAQREKEPTYMAAEEALANAYMLAKFRSGRSEMRVRGKQEALKTFTRRQPAGYRDGASIRAIDWVPRLEELTALFGAHGAVAGVRHDLWTRPTRIDWTTFYPIVPRVPWRYCAIHLVDDLKRYGLPPGVLQYFSRIGAIEESDQFQKMLRRLPHELQRAWQQQKARLAEAITAGADLKPWPPGGKDVYSVRVNKSVRAHLKFQRAAQSWTALEIGSHTAMGHG